MPPLFCPRMVLWHLVRSPSNKPSRHGRRRSYYYSETVTGCRARLVPLLELNQPAPASLWLDALIPVLRAQLEDLAGGSFSERFPRGRDRGMVLGQQPWSQGEEERGREGKAGLQKTAPLQ